VRHSGFEDLEMALKAYLLSFLARQRLVLEQKFEARYPHHWLVWEPGTWKAPPANAAVAETREPQKGKKPQPVDASDALCFELALKPGGNDEIHIGRAESNELVLSDLTVSRGHCLLRCKDGRWSAAPAENVTAMAVGGTPVLPGGELPLAPGQQLELGDVQLTLLDPKALCARIDVAATKLKRP
jgi:hypothetical protein